MGKFPELSCGDDRALEFCAAGTPTEAAGDRVSTGLCGLDQVLAGGLPRNGMYLVEGPPGTGKTTMAIQFLLAGARQEQHALFVSFSQAREELYFLGSCHGWDMDEVILADHSFGDIADVGWRQTLFPADDVQLVEAVEYVTDAIGKFEPDLMVLDSLADLRALCGEPSRLQHEMMRIKRFAKARGCTTLVVDDSIRYPSHLSIENIVDGTVRLEQFTPVDGPTECRLRVSKMRGLHYRSGYHGFAIRRGGLVVFPRPTLPECQFLSRPQVLPSGIHGLDELLGGGLDQGGNILLSGPSGVGKSTFAMKIIEAVAESGGHARVYLFGESRHSLMRRSDSLGMKLPTFAQENRISFGPTNQIDLTAAELVHLVCSDAQKDDARLIVIDSLDGLLGTIPDQEHLLVQFHQLLTYLAHTRVTLLVAVGQPDFEFPGARLSVARPMFDTHLSFRFFVRCGELRPSVLVTKRRAGDHCRSAHEILLGGSSGVAIGQPVIGPHWSPATA